MRNSVLSSAPSQQYYNCGSNDFQMPNLGISTQVDSIVPSVQRNDFSMDSILFKDDPNQLTDGGFAVPYHSNNYYQQGFQSMATSCDSVSQQEFSLNRMCSLPQFDVDFESLQSPRIHAIEASDHFPQQGTIADLSFKKTSLKVSKKIKNRKNIKVDSFVEEQWHRQNQMLISPQIQEHRVSVPVRRSQKLSDKITALQKLVSPYGKTDTASVLQEASLYIRLLQEQIQNLFQMLSGSYNIAQALHLQEMGEQKLDLRGRGLCLVPLSLTQKATQEDVLEPSTISGNNMADTRL